MLKNLFQKIAAFCHDGKSLGQQFDNNTQYWEWRVRKFGKRSVLNLGYSKRQFSKITNRQKKEIYPYFVNALNGDEELLLDFGCGSGRFTCDLATMINGRAIGTDINVELLAMAPRMDWVEYQLMEEGRIPISDEHFDVVWVCLVLGGISGDLLTKTAQEIKRVLKPGGLLFLVENTSEVADEKHWAYRQVPQYAGTFSFLKLVLLHEYYDLGERISLMSGRKP
jgi:ubiquinone/menaquinone biosynthesis C-methylase UbiE